MRSEVSSDTPRRSAGTLPGRRVPLPWPEEKEFRILSIDGGGIRGVFPAAFLAELEHRYLGDSSIANYFDLIAGTSTGGIIALGLAAGLCASDLRELYISRGHEVFPPPSGGILALPKNWIGKARRLFKYRYDSESLKRVIECTLGTRKFGEAKVRLCIPSADGKHSEPYIFKTPHHPDYKKDKKEYMTKVAMATAAAPTFFQPFADSGYIFLDGGLWANDPIMVGLVDSLSCYSIDRAQVRILSIGCGSRPYIINRKRVRGGLWAWRKIIESAMHLQSSNALGQAGLLIGRDRITRVDPGPIGASIELDDWAGAIDTLPRYARKSADRFGPKLSVNMLYQRADEYRPILEQA
ncbi:MAG: CBASS cGAMP-activated phospholipase [Gammaproteobacteria bacterium]|nr:CBASS cGAMP-activated phospholipase [Gammaproteobacteria bacterium]